LSDKLSRFYMSNVQRPIPNLAFSFILAWFMAALATNPTDFVGVSCMNL